MTGGRVHTFDRNGIAAVSDLASEEWQGIYSRLEEEQSEFLSQEDRFRSPKYRWPRDPLHTWSRVWEYPYVYHHLRRWREKCEQTTCPHAVDVGSGVTSFPFSVARLGYRVTCVDVDPIVGVDLPRATEVVDHAPGQVDFRLCDDSHLPFDNREVDLVYSISVVEHVPRFEELIAEVARILKSGGLFVLTIDLDMRGDTAIGVHDHARLMRCLEDRFEYCCPFATVHPLDVLSSNRGPYPVLKPSVGDFWPREIARRLLGRLSRQRIPFDLTVEGIVLRRPTGKDESTGFLGE